MARDSCSLAWETRTLGPHGASVPGTMRVGVFPWGLVSATSSAGTRDRRMADGLAAGTRIRPSCRRSRICDRARTLDAFASYREACGRGVRTPFLDYMASELVRGSRLQFA